MLTFGSLVPASRPALLLRGPPSAGTEETPPSLPFKPRGLLLRGVAATGDEPSSPPVHPLPMEVRDVRDMLSWVTAFFVHSGGGFCRAGKERWVPVGDVDMATWPRSPELRWPSGGTGRDCHEAGVMPSHLLCPARGTKDDQGTNRHRRRAGTNKTTRDIQGLESATDGENLVRHTSLIRGEAANRRIGCERG